MFQNNTVEEVSVVKSMSDNTNVSGPANYLYLRGCEDAREGLPLQHDGQSYLAGYREGIREQRRRQHKK